MNDDVLTPEALIARWDTSPVGLRLTRLRAAIMDDDPEAFDKLVDAEYEASVERLKDYLEPETNGNAEANDG